MPCLEPLLKRLFFLYLINDRSQFAIEKAGGALQSSARDQLRPPGPGHSFHY